jgi:hypothetical protein
MTDIVDPSWIGTSVALEYIQDKFHRLGITQVKPGRATLIDWLNRGLIKTHRHGFHKFWFTTTEWIDEAIKLKRIPQQQGRPPIVMEIEREDYVAIQEMF